MKVYPFILFSLILFIAIPIKATKHTHTGGITRIIHQMWIGNDDDNQWYDAPNMWKELHPSWNYIFWDAFSCRELIASDYSWFLSYFDQIELDIQTSDVCRYFILDKYGGVYADLDMIPQVPFDGIILEAYTKDIQVLFLERSPNSQQGTNFYGSFIAIGLMASVPRAVFWNHVFGALKERIENKALYLSNHHQVIHQTGPHMIMSVYWKVHKITPGIGLFSHDKFYPCDIVCLSEFDLNACQQIQRQKPHMYPLLIGTGKSWNNWFSHFLGTISCNLPIKTVVIVIFLSITFFAFYIVMFKFRHSKWWIVFTARLLYLLLAPNVIYRFLGRSRTTLSISCIIIQLLLSIFVAKWPWNKILPRKFRKRVFLSILSFWVILVVVYYITDQKSDFSSKKVLFITAHPDDEAMFFSPTIKNLREQGWQLHLLCMTHKGDRRNSELLAAAVHMGFKYDHVYVEAFEDGFDSRWDITYAADVILDIVSSNSGFDMIISFDSMGVTGHPNHISVYNAFRRAARPIVMNYPQTKLLILDSMNPMSRFLGPIPFVFTYLKHFIFHDTTEIFGTLLPYESWSAMAHHDSQWVWYRKLNVLISTHHYYNELSELYSLSRGDRFYDEPFNYIKNAI